jgi:exonuclease III
MFRYLCLSEMKISRQLLTKSFALPENYDAVMSFPKNKGGYSGVAVYTNNTKVIPLKAEEGLTGGYQSTSKVHLDANQRISVNYPEASMVRYIYCVSHILNLMPNSVVGDDARRTRRCT